MKNKKLEEYDEIDLIDYIRVIKNSFKFIIIFTITLIIITGLIMYFIIPKKYTAESIIQIGTNENNEEISNPEETIEIIKQKPSLVVILNNLKEKDKNGLWENDNSINANSFSIKNQNIFLIINAKNNNPQKSKELVEEISNFIIEKDNKIYEKIINQIKEKKSITDGRLSLIQQQLNDDIISLSNLNNKIINLSLNNQSNATVLQAYMASMDVIKARINSYQKEIYDLKTAIKEIDNQKNIFKPTELVIESTILGSTFYNQLKLNLTLALILGLFISTLLSFIIKWWEINKKRL